MKRLFTSATFCFSLNPMKRPSAYPFIYWTWYHRFHFMYVSFPNPHFRFPVISIPKVLYKKIETDCPINKWKLTDPELNILSKIDWSVGYCTNMYILLQTLLSQMCVHTHTDTCTYFKDGNNLDKGEVLALEVKVKRTDIWKIPTVYQHYKWHAILESSWQH